MSLKKIIKEHFITKEKKIIEDPEDSSEILKNDTAIFEIANDDFSGELIKFEKMNVDEEDKDVEEVEKTK